RTSKALSPIFWPTLREPQHPKFHAVFHQQLVHKRDLRPNLCQWFDEVPRALESLHGLGALAQPPKSLAQIGQAVAETAFILHPLRIFLDNLLSDCNCFLVQWQCRGRIARLGLQIAEVGQGPPQVVAETDLFGSLGRELLPSPTTAPQGRSRLNQSPCPLV